MSNLLEAPEELTHDRRSSRWTSWKCSHAGSSPSGMCRRSAFASWWCCCNCRGIVFDEAPRSLVNKRWYPAGVAAVNSTLPSFVRYTPDPKRTTTRGLFDWDLLQEEKEEEVSANSPYSRDRDRANDHGSWIAARTLTSGASLRLAPDKISSAFARRGVSAFPKTINRDKKNSDLAV